MTHEPECPTGKDWYEMCECETLRSAYRRGREDAAKAVETALGDYVYGEDFGPPEFRIVAAARGDDADDRRECWDCGACADPECGCIGCGVARENGERNA